MQTTIDTAVIDKAESWLTPAYDEQTQTEVKALLEAKSDALVDAFYKDLEFGTGGLRGIMGVGSNRINKYTIGMATQGLANYLNQTFSDRNDIAVAIAYDSRINSSKFARNAAEVLAGNGIKVYLFDKLRPTPELSFAIRHFGCQAGIVITASHNPKEYNGYKVYWEDGGQLVPPHDGKVIAEVRKVIDPSQVKSANDADLIQLVGEDVDNIYLDALTGLSLSPEAIASHKDLKIVYTSLHGTGGQLIPSALKRFGFQAIHTVSEQDEPNGSFPTVHSPNPEEAEALTLALNLAKEVDAELVMGTDPDTDRVGIAVRDNAGDFKLLNGNQAGSILVYYLLEKWKASGKLTGKEFVCKTIVTSQLINKIAAHYNVTCIDTLTGFKWIAEQIKLREGQEVFIGGGEESYGYLVGDVARDKDAVISAVMFAEIAAWAKDQGLSFYQLLTKVYKQFGFFKEHLVSITKKGKKGADEIAEMMQQLRDNTPHEVIGQQVITKSDYASSEAVNLSTQTVNAIDLPKSNVIQLQLEDGTVITARPSGTEPKIKFYISTSDQLPNDISDHKSQEAVLDAKINSIIEALNLN